jgi:hypothetical protein
MNELAPKENDLGFLQESKRLDDVGLIQVEQSRAVAEVQTKYVMANKFPRNQAECYVAIIDTCKRPFLAEQAMYAYPRGGTMVIGPSIRLAEALAQCWGRIDFGIRELSQSNGVSIAEAYAIDLQTQTSATKIFHVPHVRDTKKGRVKLTDARDIYEMVANQGARRMRACILAILPGDVVEAAVNRCKQTLESSEIPLSERIRAMVLKFDELGVKVEHLEKRLGHKMESTISAELVTLTGIFKSIRDGIADREDFFDIGKGANSEADLDNLLEAKKRQPNPKTGEIKKDDDRK